jgi:GalNAc-alpha-(1->4)-GalNAc-alpha-(1->3)-diNAcBac-PP-undecaprenol alpha-1,4-N-acetyl-D-galactosaminyltransferase
MHCALLLSDLGGGGTQRLALGLAGHLCASGHRVEVLTLATAGSRFPVPPGVAVTGLEVTDDSRGLLDAVVANLCRVRRLRAALVQSGPDVLVSFLTSTNVLALLAAPLGLPVLVTEESDPAHESTARPWVWLRRWTYRRAVRVIVHAKGARRYFRGGWARVAVIPNPIAPCPKGRISPGSEPLLLGMGRLSPEKGFDVLLAAFARLAPRFPDWRLEILGDGPMRGELTAMVRELGLLGRAALPGFSATPSDRLARGALFCSAARVEGFGLALCEAMACGLPVVATDAPSGPRDIVRPGIDGELVPVDDLDALVGALAKLMGDPARRAAMGARAREITTRFAPARIWASWEAEIVAASAVGNAARA